jgi:hypothetical protein
LLLRSREKAIKNQDQKGSNGGYRPRENNRASS